MGQKRWKVVGCKCLAGDNVDPSFILGLEIPDTFLHLGLEIKYLLSQGLESLSCIGQDNPFPYLVEEHQVMGTLQLLDLPGHSRLGDTQFLSSPSIAFKFSYIVERFEMIKIHNKNYKLQL